MKILRLEQFTAQDPEFAFWCAGCDTVHHFRTNGRDGRSFNRDYIKPTIRPAFTVGGRTHRCHFAITWGRVRYFEDSVHGLAGQDIELPDMPE